MDGCTPIRVSLYAYKHDIEFTSYACICTSPRVGGCEPIYPHYTDAHMLTHMITHMLTHMLSLTSFLAACCTSTRLVSVPVTPAGMCKTSKMSTGMTINSINETGRISSAAAANPWLLTRTTASPMMGCRCNTCAESSHQQTPQNIGVFMEA